MPKRSSNPDINQIAKNIVEHSTNSQPELQLKNAAAVALGKLGGKKGGKARAAALSGEQRSAIARKAAVKRWGLNRTKKTVRGS